MCFESYLENLYFFIRQAIKSDRNEFHECVTLYDEDALVITDNAESA